MTGKEDAAIVLVVLLLVIAVWSLVYAGWPDLIPSLLKP